MNRFSPFSLEHAACILTWAAFTVLLVAGGRRLARKGGDEKLRRLLGWGGIGFSLAHQAWWMLPPWGALQNLPLHLCDLNGFIAPLALLTRRRWLRALLYFWSFGLSLQGLVEPTLTTGPATMHFWWFWISHGMIMSYALYDLIVGAYRPVLPDLLIVLAITSGYFVVMAVFDALTGFNYGFLGATKPENPTLIDVLGPWPWRLGVIYVLGLIVFVALWLPWALVARRAKSPATVAGRR